MAPSLATIEARLARLPVGLAVLLPSGQRLGAADAPVVVHVRAMSALASLAAGQIGAFAAAVVEGLVCVEGRMRDIMQVAAHWLQTDPLHVRGGRMGRAFSHALAWLRSRSVHTLARDAENIRFHYDIGDDFYALWLDPRRVYSCAYFGTADMTLAQAQEAKLDLICRKLRLQPGERLLDIGAGWGALLLWAAEHYGASAYGITLSRRQHEYVRQCIAQRGLQGRVQIELRDWRELAPEQPFDKVVSVGMFEHVGRAHMARYFAAVRRLLRPGALALIHGITAGGAENPRLGAGMGQFIGRYIFPGGELLHISAALREMARGGLEMVDTENLRPHYARTLWCWSDALEARLPQAQHLLAAQLGPQAGAKALRAWRLYLAGCALGFERGWVAVHQMLCIRPDAGSAYPFNRAYMYQPG